MSKKKRITNYESAKKIWLKQIIPSLFLVLFVCVGLYFFINAIISTGITKGPDHMFGDQHLKTSVALIELHKIRYGSYPEKLSDIKFEGQWDAIALNSVYYLPSPDLTSYYIEVSRGWVGKPKGMKMPNEFWQGTGFDRTLKKKDDL